MKVMSFDKARERQAFRRWRAGHVAAAQRQLELVAAERPGAAQAVREALCAFDMLNRDNACPSARDPVSERGVEEVRRRWARIQRHARQQRP
jgi:hypothetical protein